MSKKKRTTNLKCQCCREEQPLDSYRHVQKCHDEMQKLHPDYGLMERIQRGRACCSRWACDECLKRGVAIKASISAQRVSDCHPEPNTAYFDETKSCRKCNQSFVFSKEEQKHWYEQLKFMSWSKCITCVKCRKDERFISIRTTELSKLLPSFEAGDHSELERIVRLYLELDNKEAAKRFLAGAARLLTKNEQQAELVTRLRNELRN